MPTRFSYSRGLPSSPAQNQEWRKPGHSLQFTIPSFRLTAYLSGLVLVAFSLVRSPDQQEPQALTPLILRGHTDQVNAVAFAPNGRTLASSLNIAAFNLGNALGAWAGGVTIDRGLGLSALPLIAAGTTAIGLVLALWSLRLDRRPDAVAVCPAE